MDVNQTSLYNKKCHCHPDNDNETTISLLLFTDGIPLCKSKNIAFWPILATVAELPPGPRRQLGNMILLALHKGAKPIWKDYLGPVIRNIQNVHNTLFIVNNRSFRVRLLCVIMDAQAKASV